jgi:hypothetical protein
MQELIRAINGTLQTRVPRLSIEDNEVEIRRRKIDFIFELYFRIDRFMWQTIWRNFRNSKKIILMRIPMIQYGV